MKKITYKDIKVFDENTLKRLFVVNEWESGKYPKELKVAFENSGSVYSAWDGDKLVGLINALDDSIMTAYIHYMLIDPEYKRLGIGKQLIDQMKERYKDYLTVVLVSYEMASEFYIKCGFTHAKDGFPMFLSKGGL